MMIGILPTIHDQQLCLANMSALNRYKALNERIMNARKGSPLRLNITGVECLRSEHHDVMLESAATSFQIHRQVPFNKSKRYYNAAVICSAVTVAVGANSPYLFGKHLWEETRIPLFEQAVEVGGYGGADHGPIRRVSFGNGYVKESLEELFIENFEHFPILLPANLTVNNAKLPYTRLHNGTIWRWNRPLLGFDDDGTPHLRIEHRVISAGPTVIDEIANTAFFFGLHESLATQEMAPELSIEFSAAKDNFYKACRLGLQAKIDWLNGEHESIKSLVLHQLLPMAEKGLASLGVDQQEAKHYLDIIHQRVSSERTGAHWQVNALRHFQGDMQAMTEAYWQNQRTAKPVHEWPLLGEKDA
jgi:hypothetical protein